MIGAPATTKTQCQHCGDQCIMEDILWENLHFCCDGCLTVYRILKDNDLTAYYRYTETPGSSQRARQLKEYDFLDDEDIRHKLLSFNEGTTQIVTFTLPDIHCSSCLWLLENITKLNDGVQSSRVNFIKKEATIKFDGSLITLRQLAELLAKIGYEPDLNLANLEDGTSTKSSNKRLIYQLGLAGFAFGNIMLLSFPEYLGFHKASITMFVGYINIILALPVLVYSCADYLKSAWISLRRNRLNIDVPVAIGMVTLFSRSLYEIISQTGEGYLDSFAGFVFFLLIGKWFQSFTYKALDFDRSYKSYFPISARIRQGADWINKSIEKVVIGDVILIKHQELIPTDATVLAGKARIDYSFVTGESEIIHKSIGDEVLAGGKQMGNNVELLVKREINQSYLTKLWNEDAFKKQDESSSGKLIAGISRYFTQIIVVIALVTFGYWWFHDQTQAFRVFTAVLIVACPCALALSIPFTYGNLLRLLSEKGMYLRNVETIEQIQDVDHVIFDKTGTITDSTLLSLEYIGRELTTDQLVRLKSACHHSGHPLSKAIVAYLDHVNTVEVDHYEDVIGSGLMAKVDGHDWKVGSSAFLFGTAHIRKERGVFLEEDGNYLGYFKFEHSLRTGIDGILQGLKGKYQVSLLSGDSDVEADRIHELFESETNIHFNQSPEDKLNYIKSLQSHGHNVMMIGDGLNDAGALKQSNVGIVISDDANNFSPACDGIISASSFNRLLQMIVYVKDARWIIYGAFTMALMYNLIGLYFAISGQLSPIIAAILMPLSSISVIVYGVVSSLILYKFRIH